jgi:large subunit ribosomal protein L18e
MKNIQLTNLIQNLRKKSIDDKMALWSRLAQDLERPTRNRRAVNLSKINRFSNDNEVVVVPGKVLSSGEITRKVTVAAYTFSGQAAEKLQKAGCIAISLQDLMSKKDIKNIRIIG